MSRTVTAETYPVEPAYFDSALVAKFYLNEPGRDLVRTLARSSGIVVTSGIAVAEVSAAFHRKYREESIDKTIFEALMGQFRHDLGNRLWRLAGPTDALIEAAHDLFAVLDPVVFLRSLDALHLVTAQAEGFERLYSNDRHLLLACGAIGLVGINPVEPMRSPRTKRTPRR